MKVTETNLGFLIEAPQFVALFGGQKSQLLNLQSSFETYQFLRIKQTHGDTVVHSQDYTLDYKVKADAHYTQAEKTALCISTADCIPVLIYEPRTNYIAAVHAGWRGVANRIVPKTIQTLVDRGAAVENMQVLVGPHIQMNSFEVDNPVRDQILDSIQFFADQNDSLYHKNINAQKSLVDLNQVMKTQMQNCGVVFDHLYNLHLDTYTDLRFHSYRRDKEKSGRQLSFICKR
jgi:hypothetical protein